LNSYRCFFEKANLEGVSVNAINNDPALKEFKTPAVKDMKVPAR